MISNNRYLIVMGWRCLNSFWQNNNGLPPFPSLYLSLPSVSLSSFLSLLFFLFPFIFESFFVPVSFPSLLLFLLFPSLSLLWEWQWQQHKQQWHPSSRPRTHPIFISFFLCPSLLFLCLFLFFPSPFVFPICRFFVLLDIHPLTMRMTATAMASRLSPSHWLNFISFCYMNIKLLQSIKSQKMLYGNKHCRFGRERDSERERERMAAGTIKYDWTQKRGKEREWRE